MRTFVRASQIGSGGWQRACSVPSADAAEEQRDQQQAI